MSETVNPNTNSFTIPLEVDGEVIDLNPNSAEGKAVQRRQHPIAESEWVNVAAKGEIDMEVVRQRIEERGYKTQVFTED